MNTKLNNSQEDLNLEFQTTSNGKWVSNNFKVTSNLFLWNFQLSFLKYEEVILSSLMNSLSCLKFLSLKYFKWNSNHFQTPFHFFKWKKSYYLHSRVLWWNEFEFRKIKMQDESFGKVLLFPLIQLSKSFKFHSISHNQSHNNQTNNHNYLFNITFQNLEFWDVTNYHP